MRAGPMRNRVTIEAPVEARDAYGQKIPGWEPCGTFWAQIRALAGREAVNAKQIRAEVTHAVRMRHIGGRLPAPGLLTTMRILFDGRTFNISWVNDVDERHREYNLLAQELTPAVPT